MIKGIFRKYPEIILAALAIFFIALLLSVFSWGIGNVVGSVNRAVNATGTGSGDIGFDLQGAKALNLRGLVK